LQLGQLVLLRSDVALQHAAVFVGVREVGN
jgi:hypothetical protein